MLAALALAMLLHAPHDPVNCWAVSPDFAADHTIFVGQNAFGMLLRSRDGGQTWRTVQAGLDTGYVHAIAISPDFAKDRTLYAAEAGGLFRTLDAGERWVKVDNLPHGAGVRTVAFSPHYASDRTIALGTGSGLLLSPDAGATWVQMPLPGKGAVDAIVFEDGYADGGSLLVLRGPDTAALSNDGGRHFEALPLPPGGRLTSAVLQTGFGLRGALSIAKGAAGVWTSGDFGKTWKPDNAGLPAGDQVLHLSKVKSGHGHIVEFASLARAGVFRRVDGGAWEGGRQGMRELSDQSAVHHYATAAVPDFATEPVVYAATFEGLHVSVDGGTSWSHLQVLPPRFSRNVLLAPGFAADGTLLVASYGDGLLIGKQGGAHWDRIDTGPWAFPDGVALSPGWPADPTLLVGTPTALLLSRDGGKSFSNCRPGAPGFLHVGAFAPDYASSGTIYAHTFEFGNESKNDFLRSDDRGATWTRTGPRTIHDLAFAPDFASSGRMYVATSGDVQVSHDRGRTWAALPGLPHAMMYGIAATAGSDGDQLLAVSPMAGVYASTDGGGTWERSEAGLAGARATGVAFSPDHAHDGLAFLLTQGQGVFAKADGEAAWRPSGLAGEYALRLALSPDFSTDHTLAVAGYSGVSISRDAGATWTRLDPTSNTPQAVPPARRDGAAGGGGTQSVPTAPAGPAADHAPPRELLIGAGVALLVAAALLVLLAGARPEPAA